MGHSGAGSAALLSLPATAALLGWIDVGARSAGNPPPQVPTGQLVFTRRESEMALGTL